MAQPPPLNVNVAPGWTSRGLLTDAELEESLARLRKQFGLDDNLQSDPKAVAPKYACAFCGELGAPQAIETGLRCQDGTWHVCHRTSCNETIPYHRERIEAGLVDCAETRGATLKWVKGKLGFK